MPADRRFLFIGGAPRSGTTWLFQLFDSHPQIAGFPVEHLTFDRFFGCPPDQREPYFRTEFLTHGEGQQALLADDGYRESKRRQLLRERGKARLVDVDTALFRNTYVSNLENPSDDNLLVRTLSALSEAALVSVPDSRAPTTAAENSYLVFKQPYYTELYALQVAELIPTARFIHLIRNPVARYISAKNRRIRKTRSNRRYCARINHVNFVAGHSEVSASSMALAMANQAELGKDRYEIVYYEDVLHDINASMQSLASWLSIDFAPELLVQTQLGASAEPNTSANSLSPMQTGTASRLNEIASGLEKDLLAHYLSISGLFGRYEIGAPRTAEHFRRIWRQRLKFERVRDYARRQISPVYNPLKMNADEIRELLVSRLPKMVLERRATLSGAV